MKGIARLHGSPKKQALALRLEDLEKISLILQAEDKLEACQIRALILLGFFLGASSLRTCQFKMGASVI